MFGRAVRNLELLGRMATEPLRNLNTGSAKATTWAVRILHPKQDSTYGREKQSKMHTLDCLLVSDDPAVYCGGAWKSPREQDIQYAMEKLRAKASWKMSKERFSIRGRSLRSCRIPTNSLST